jgi:hypothetical protein
VPQPVVENNPTEWWLLPFLFLLLLLWSGMLPTIPPPPLVYSFASTVALYL